MAGRLNRKSGESVVWRPVSPTTHKSGWIFGKVSPAGRMKSEYLSLRISLSRNPFEAGGGNEKRDASNAAFVASTPRFVSAARTAGTIACFFAADMQYIIASSDFFRKFVTGRISHFNPNRYGRTAPKFPSASPAGASPSRLSDESLRRKNDCEKQTLKLHHEEKIELFIPDPNSRTAICRRLPGEFGRAEPPRRNPCGERLGKHPAECLLLVRRRADPPDRRH